jgi:hypothetical protein
MAVEAFYPCAATLTTATNDTARGAVTGGGSYAYGTFVTLTAQAAEGCFFAGWSDGDTANPRIVHLTADTLFRALFFAVRIDRVVVCDTLWVRDTVYPTFFRLRVESDDTARGLGVGSGLLPAGTEAEVCGLPLEGFRFLGWSDGEAANPRRVTLTADTVLRALFAPAAIGEVSLPHWTATLEGLRLTVRCAAGERLRLYDALGRLCRETVATDEATTLELPATGVWLLRVGDGAARKIVARGR